MKLSGLVCIRNSISLDYTIEQTVKSLLPVCDEVVVCDGESTDGTQELIRDWMGRDSRIKLCVYPWPNPVAQIKFWTDWIQYGRGHCKGERILQLDGDELLHEESTTEVLDMRQRPGRFSCWCKRWNFWRDAQHLIPEGICCSHRVVRLAPQNIFLPSDGPDPMGAEAIGMAINSNIHICHYGFLRKRKALFEKSRQLQNMFFGTYDGRLSKVEAKEGNWMEQIEDVEWINNLLPYNGTHPKLIQEWLIERGYKP